MSKLKEFTASSARPLPVILLADVSGSMSINGKIETLNEAASEMIETFAEEDDSRAEIHIGVITFGGGGAKLHHPLTPASKIRWQNMMADGHTPMGAALDLAAELVEDKRQIPGRAYRPTLILISDGQPTDSDGQPTDDWQSALQRLLKSERASKATRFALGIGEDADLSMLQAFLADPEGRVFEAHEARQIKQFFRWVTMSVTTRSRSINPNSMEAIEPEDVEDFKF